MLLNFKKKNISEISFLIYKKIVLHSRNKIFYSYLRVPDSIDGRFDLIVLHFFFIHDALFRKGTLEEKVYNEILSIMYKDFDLNLREIGVGDLSVGKKIYQMSEAIAGRIKAYTDAKSNKKLLSSSLLRNIYGKSSKNIDKKTATIMVDYFMSSLKKIKKNKLLEIKENSDIFFDLQKLI